MSSHLPGLTLYLCLKNPSGKSEADLRLAGSLCPSECSRSREPADGIISVEYKEENGHYRSLRPSVGGVPLLASALPTPLPGGVPNPTSVAELAVQFRVGARGLLQAPTAIAVLVLLAPDQGISLRVKPALCSPRHVSENSRAVTKEKADDRPSLRRRPKVQYLEHTPPCERQSIHLHSANGPNN